jgi:hypothetical protein
MLPRHSMLKNLAADLQARKLRMLRDVLASATGQAPTSFRAGRFGLGPETVRALIDAGFRVDSSVTPWIDWTGFDDGPDFRGAPQGCYRVRADQDHARRGGAAEPSCRSRAASRAGPSAGVRPPTARCASTPCAGCRSRGSHRGSESCAA